MVAAVPSGAVEVVRAFLGCTVDAPDEARARGMLTKASLAEGGFHMPAAGPASYEIGEAVLEGGQVYVPVTLKDGETGQEVTMPLAPVLEDGQWKLDMGKMFEKLMGGAMEQMVEQVGTAMGAAMEGVGQALTAALGGSSEEAGEEVQAQDEASAAEEVKRIEEQAAALQGDLEQHAKQREEELEKVFGVRIPYAFEWERFRADEDARKNLRALTLLREHGIDAIYLALTGLAEQDADFRGRIARRVRWIYLDHPAGVDNKRVWGEQTTLALRIFLREGDEGYFTVEELKKALPGIVAEMPDIE
ncbi:MAG TPA: hypothetical protein VHQ47_16860 [Phycisphaerae bacterium]|nr:hypothetical protein [Phycisphaerae bacterium]